jgi:hypothetical protein
VNFIRAELGFANVNFKRAELCECEIPETELSIENANIMRAELLRM